MIQISDERLLALEKNVASAVSFNTSHWQARNVSNGELSAIIDRLRATESERNAYKAKLELATALIKEAMTTTYRTLSWDRRSKTLLAETQPETVEGEK